MRESFGRMRRDIDRSRAFIKLERLIAIRSSRLFRIGNVYRACEGNNVRGKREGGGGKTSGGGKKNKGDDTGEGSLSRSTRVSSSRWVKRDP